MKSMHKDYTNQHVFNTYSDKLIFNDNNDNWNNTYNFQIVIKNCTYNTVLKDNLHNKRNNIFHRYFYDSDIEYAVEIKNFKYFKIRSHITRLMDIAPIIIIVNDKLDYILFNNGDLCSLDIENFRTHEQLNFICNICSIINVNEVIQIQPYKINNPMTMKCILTGFFILDINHKLFKLENEEIFLINKNVNVFEIFINTELDGVAISTLFVENSKKIVFTEYAITKDYDQKLCTIGNHEYGITLSDDIIDINFIYDSISLKLSSQMTKTMFLDRDTYHITDNISSSFITSIFTNNNVSYESNFFMELINYNIPMIRPNYTKNKYYDGKLTINLLMIINKPIIFRLLLCLKKMNTYPPLLVIETILSYLTINDFGKKIVSFLE